MQEQLASLHNFEETGQQYKDTDQEAKKSRKRITLELAAIRKGLLAAERS